uniref:Uncharacterized protein n=1 Tax=Anopheles christyi TaxID=43041 RepID=A0A182KI26_9DIPT
MSNKSNEDYFRCYKW